MTHALERLSLELSLTGAQGKAQMNNKITLQIRPFVLAAPVVLLGVIGLSPKAEAAIAKDIVFFGGGPKLGSIVFSAVSGSSSAEVEFKLTESGKTFTQANITSISWMLDSSTHEVLSLSLSALIGDSVCDAPVVGGCANAVLALHPHDFSITTHSCPPPAEPPLASDCSSPISEGGEIEFIDAAPAYACVGFEPPLADGPITVKGKRALPIKAEVLDEDGAALTDADLSAAPVVQVTYQSGIGATPEDVSDQTLWVGQGTIGNAFVFSGSKWKFNLKTGNYTAPGTYTITMVSGDEAEYRVDPTCEAQFVVSP
jgi:hypothetical protein